MVVSPGDDVLDEFAYLFDEWLGNLVDEDSGEVESPKEENIRYVEAVGYGESNDRKVGEHRAITNIVQKFLMKPSDDSREDDGRFRKGSITRGAYNAWIRHAHKWLGGRSELQQKAITLLGSVERAKVKEVIGTKKTARSVTSALQRVKLLSPEGKRAEAEAIATAQRQSAKLASSYITRMRSFSGDTDRINALVKEASSEVSGKEFDRIRRTANFLIAGGEVGEV